MTEPYNASDPKQVRKAAKAAKLVAASHRLVVLNLMSSPGGRAFVWDLLTTCHVFNRTFTGEALSSAFSEGERNIGLQLITLIMAHASEQYIFMMREAKDKEDLNGRRTSSNDRRLGSEPDLGRDDNDNAGDEYVERDSDTDGDTE